MTVTEDPAAPVGARVEGSRRTRDTGPRPYDFRRPTKLSREHLRTLQIVFETFARQYTTLLTSRLRVVAQVNLVSIEQQTYDEYIASLNNPTLMAILSVEPMPGAGIFEFSLTSAMNAVDHLLGGPGGGNQPERPLTDIELAILRGLMNRALGELRYALEAVTKLEPALMQVEYNPQFAQAAAAGDMVLVASFDQRIGGEDCIATVCLPFNALSARLEVAATSAGTSEREKLLREASRRSLTSRLEDVPVEVAVRFAPARLGSATLAELAVGDVLPLRHALNSPLAVTAADVVFAQAVPGSQGKRLACLVVEPPEEEQPS